MTDEYAKLIGEKTIERVEMWDERNFSHSQSLVLRFWDDNTVTWGYDS